LKTDRFEIYESFINGVSIINRKIFEDNRGSFSRLFCEREMLELDLGISISQVNISKTDKKGTVRGMHFQDGEFAEDKYIICLKGSIFDVAVDVRSDSKTFLKWDSAILSSKEDKMIFIPKGVAHGFQTLEDDCWLVYLHTEKYQQNSESGLNPTDPRLAIDWPLSVEIISEKDKNRNFLRGNSL
jgi:dTDP-4-dehydrorhamnose 3,5-epimerase